MKGSGDLVPLPLAIALFILCVAPLAAAQTSASAPGNSGIVPVTIHYREIADGTFDRELAEAYRSDGAWAKWTLRTTGKENGDAPRSIYVPGIRQQVLISDALKAISTYYQGPAAPVGSGASAKDCRGVAGNLSPMGKGEPILGYDTLLFAPPELRGTPTVERFWLAPALNCRQLRYEKTDIETRAASMTRFERVVTVVTPGEPKAELFQIPDGYEEMPPSEMQMRHIEKRTGVPFGSRPTDRGLLPGFKRADRNYRNSLQWKPAVPFIEPPPPVAP